MKCQITCSKIVITAIAINIIMVSSCTNALKASPAQENNNSILYNFNSEEIKKKGDINYKIAQVNSIISTDLVIFQIDQLAVSPFLYILEEKDGKCSLNFDVPEKKIADLFEMAAKELENDNYEQVKNIYQKAYDLDSLYFKSASNLGDAWNFLGDYRQAEYYLKRAIKLNGAGYQEYLFLADVYDKSGKGKDALEAITYAFMLNKNNPYLIEFLKKILQKNNLCLNENRLEFPFKIRKTGVKECEIQYHIPDGIVWSAMADCLASWEMEPELQIRLCGEDKYNYKIKMYRECLLNQGYYLEGLKTSGKKLSRNEENFLEKIQKKYVNCIVYWEILAGEEPYILFMLPQKERQLIVEYIKKYVYQTRTN